MRARLQHKSPLLKPVILASCALFPSSAAPQSTKEAPPASKVRLGEQRRIENCAT